MDKLKQYRKEIDSIDNKLIELLNKRLDLSKAISIFKKQNNIDTIDKKREEEIINKYLSLSKKEYNNQINGLIKSILKMSKDLQ